MPIKRENRARYPKDWKAIRARIQARAGDRCESCAVVNGSFRTTGTKTVRIVCTTAHLDHQPENCDDSNLRFLCQRCHLRYDHQHHLANRRRKEQAAP